MSKILPFLKSLLSVPGLAGYEAPVQDLITDEWNGLVDEISQSNLGSLHALKNGNGKSPRPSVLIATHMDTVGLMVSRVVEEFLYVTNIGHLDPRVLPGTAVTVHASAGEPLFGVVVMPPASLLPKGEGDGVIGMNFLLVDTGLAPREVSMRVKVGDPVSFNTGPIEISEDYLCGHALDNRASIAALTICLQELQDRPHIWDLWAIAPVQEEVSFAGAFTSTHQLHPSIAVAVDVTYGMGAGETDYSMFPLGKGVTLGIGPSIHPFLHRRFREVAARMDIPVTDEPMPEASLTDADAMQVSTEGVPTMVMGIPLRYMHTPVEVVALEDIQHAGHLLAGFVASLEADFLDWIVWN